ncbi:hypothetical protein BDV28DRAFT_134035 [Aspergillus coremiiformis]|uniref:GPI-anchored cell surface glycoprotein n=1 Tax=Aspergillus coremiiformis TaxID=138285 RepID=A0A5N6ZAA5_9EURO|nr:hypothetical protein BDV28DRAFT_134035 [Aspergillus coremiiformis]
MSLNGLDNPTVIEAYQTALSEAGGWFLLHYLTRDEVALLDRGTGGVPEVRNAMDSYEEKSPLYGFLQYRRRKVVLSYLPEGISRLVQARTTVQFQSVLDKFTPHDTVFSLSLPSELTESALSSACLLHAASGSITSSSNSLRRRRLMEIAEDAEETLGSKDTPPPTAPSKDFRQRSFSQLSEATIVASPLTSDPHSILSTEPSAPTKPPGNIQAHDRRPSTVSDRHAERPASRKSSRDELSFSEPRRSTQSARPSLKDLERTGAYTPKVKLGPRPSVDGSGRPRTAGNLSRSAEQRPVASLPAGIRSSSLRRNSPSPARPRSHGSSVVSMSGRRAPPMPPLLVPPLSMPISRPQLSPAAKSLSALSSTGMQEKERLMKALQLRKTQMEKKKQERKNSPKDAEERKDLIPDPIEDKENIGHDHDNMKRVQADENKATALEHSKSPLSETQASVVPAPVEIHDHLEAFPDTIISQPAPESATTALRDTSETTAEPSANARVSPDPDPCQAAQVVSEPENDIAGRDFTRPISNEAKSGPGSPSAVKGVPLEDKSLTTPDEEIASPPAENLLAPVEQEADTIGEPAESPLSQSVPVPTYSSPDSRPTSTSDTSTAVETHATETQNDLTPEVSVAEQKDVDTRKEKRRPQLKPIRVLTPDYSDDDNLSDDSFMEELKSATLEEARPISVGMSPLSPGYSNNGNDRSPPDAWKNSRAVSNPSAIGRQTANLHALAVGRSVSTSYPEADSPVLVAKKINVSSGISKRIKALEKFSSRADVQPTPNQNLSGPSTSASFEALRKRASVSLNNNSDSVPGSRPGSFTPETFSRTSSLRRRDSQSSTTGTRTNSVSVTARIVRDTSPTLGDAKSDPSENSVLNLHASPLTVEHDTCESPPPDSPAEPVDSKSEQLSMSTSSAGSASQPFALSMPRSESRMSFSSISKNEATKSATDSPPSPEGKKESRASRLLRQESMPDTAVEIAQVIDIGEVNVQFPDTLLWKRRFVRVDEKGYLVLTPGNVDSSNRSMVKRYHLSEFRTPTLPDEDRQELPNSIVLDFLDGSTLQCACESRQGQAFVLQTLVNAHITHQQLPQ